MTAAAGRGHAILSHGATGGAIRAACGPRMHGAHGCAVTMTPPQCAVARREPDDRCTFPAVAAAIKTDARRTGLHQAGRRRGRLDRSRRGRDGARPPPRGAAAERPVPRRRDRLPGRQRDHRRRRHHDRPRRSARSSPPNTRSTWWRPRPATASPAAPRWSSPGACSPWSRRRSTAASTAPRSWSRSRSPPSRTSTRRRRALFERLDLEPVAAPVARAARARRTGASAATPAGRRDRGARDRRRARARSAGNPARLSPRTIRCGAPRGSRNSRRSADVARPA